MTRTTVAIARFAIYARYSSNLQDMTSIAGQLRLCRERIASLGGVIADEYADPELTGVALWHRPELRRLLDDARAGRFDRVCVEGLDRFSRSLADMAWLYRELTYHRIGIHSLEDGEAGFVHAAIKGVMSELQIDGIAHKTRRGQIEALHDLRTQSPRLYGYTISNRVTEKGKLIRGLRSVDPDEAEVVRRIYRLYLDGMSPEQITQLLNGEGVPGHRDKPWSAAVIRGRRHTGILRHDIYRGVLVYGRSEGRRHPLTGRRQFDRIPRDKWIMVDAPELRIVDDATWHAAQEEVLKRRKRHNAVVTRYRKAAYPLTAKIRCGVCGSHMTIAGVGYYRCVRRRRHPEQCSNNRGVAREKLEARAVHRILAWLRSPERDWAALFASVEASNAIRRKALQRKADEANEGISRLVTAIQVGVSSTSLHDRVLELERARDEAIAELATIPAPPPSVSVPIAELLLDHIEQFRFAVSERCHTERREEALLALRDLFARIDVYPYSSPRRVEIAITPDTAAILALVARLAAAHAGSQRSRTAKSRRAPA